MFESLRKPLQEMACVIRFLDTAAPLPDESPAVLYVLTRVWAEVEAALVAAAHHADIASASCELCGLFDRNPRPALFRPLGVR